MKLKEIAHSRTGDKGNVSVISVIAYDPADYALLEEKITPSVSPLGLESSCTER